MIERESKSGFRERFRRFQFLGVKQIRVRVRVKIRVREFR